MFKFSQFYFAVLIFVFSSWCAGTTSRSAHYFLSNFQSTQWMCMVIPGYLLVAFLSSLLMSMTYCYPNFSSYIYYLHKICNQVGMKFNPTNTHSAAFSEQPGLTTQLMTIINPNTVGANTPAVSPDCFL